MSYRQQKTIIDSLNRDIVNLYNDNRPLTMNLNGNQRPNLYIPSFDPLAVVEYGTWRNRAPRVVGSFALRMLLTAQTSDDRLVAFSGAEANRSNQGYGFMMDADAMNSVAIALNRTDLSFRDIY